jgi:hypothetical protein
MFYCSENSWFYRDSNPDHSVVQPVGSHYADCAILTSRLVVSLSPNLFACGNSPRCPLGWRLFGLQSWSGRCRAGTPLLLLSPSHFKSQFYSSITIMTVSSSIRQLRFSSESNLNHNFRVLHPVARNIRSYLIKYFVNCCETEGIIIYS